MLADIDPLEEGTLGGNTSEENEPTDVEEASEALDEEPEPEIISEDVIRQMESREGNTLSDVEGESFDEGPIPSRGVAPTPPEEVIGTLRRLREDVGQISELGSEEGNIVDAFSFAFLKIMETLAKTLPVDVSILPREMGTIDRANVVPEAELVALYRDGRMESFDLKEPENRDLLVDVVSNVTPKFNTLIAQRRAKMERRIAFLSDVTKELQIIADSLALVG
ncbi:MAG: hypothetical protein NWE75_00850 [Candidatus Bathyarchaeota archaeon]|nr:hypothetical protein [Candidatus Bathyarchaeota archaeon]